jgi:hypothetical protein
VRWMVLARSYVNLLLESVCYDYVWVRAIRYTKALKPVIALPRIRCCIWYVPS